MLPTKPHGLLTPDSYNPDRAITVRAAISLTDVAAKRVPSVPVHPRQLAAIGDAYYRQPGNWPRGIVPTAPICIEDRSRELTLVAVDPFGTRQIYYCDQPDCSFLSLDPAELVAKLRVKPSLDPASLFSYVYFHVIPSPRSIFQGIRKIPNGHVLHRQGSRLNLFRYWNPKFHSGPRPDLAELGDELRSSMSSAVANAAAGAEKAGAFLSGGLDSSTVAGCLTRLRPGASSFSIGFSADGYDEMAFARIAARHFGTTAHEKYITPKDILASVRAVAAAFPEPFGNSSALAVYHCAKLAADHGISTLLAGDGGDELFGGNERYSKQLVFERYQRLPAAIRENLLEPAITAAAKITRRFPIGKAQSYIQQARTPLPDRLESYNYLHRHDPSEVFTPEFLESVDCSEPLTQLRNEFAAAQADHPVDRMLFLDWKFTLHDNDLVKVNRMCSFAGIQVAYPMLDPRVVDLSLRVPADWKVHRGELRWFYKRAMSDFLPRQTIQKSKHGFGLPFGVWTAEDPGLRSLAEESLRSLATRRYFQPQFIRDVLRMHQTVHATFYGELVWILMTLELWLQAHVPDARI